MAPYFIARFFAQRDAILMANEPPSINIRIKINH